MAHETGNGPWAPESLTDEGVAARAQQEAAAAKAQAMARGAQDQIELGASDYAPLRAQQMHNAVETAKSLERQGIDPIAGYNEHGEAAAALEHVDKVRADIPAPKIVNEGPVPQTRDFAAAMEKQLPDGAALSAGLKLSLAAAGILSVAKSDFLGNLFNDPDREVSGRDIIKGLVPGIGAVMAIEGASGASLGTGTPPPAVGKGKGRSEGMGAPG